MESGKYSQAIKAFSDAIELSPQYAEAYNQIGVILAWQKKYEGAVIFISKAIQIEPDNLVARRNLEAITRMIPSR